MNITYGEPIVHPNRPTIYTVISAFLDENGSVDDIKIRIAETSTIPVRRGENSKEIRERHDRDILNAIGKLQEDLRDAQK